MKFVLADRLTDLALVTAAFLFFAGSFSVNECLDALMLYAPGISLIFIPAGVKLLCLLVGGRAAAVGLFTSSIFLSTVIWKDLSLLSTVYFAIISVGTYFLAVRLIMWRFKIEPDLSNLGYWHIIVLSIFASVLNGFAHNVVYYTQGVTASEDFLSKSMAMVFGDFLGCFVVVMLFNASINMLRRSRSD